MMITFFAVTYFLCAFLISMFLNSVSSGVAGRLSDNAEIITVNQDNNSESALTYSDLGDILSKYKAVGAIKLVTKYNSGYALFDYEKTSSENRTVLPLSLSDCNMKSLSLPPYMLILLTV